MKSEIDNITAKQIILIEKLGKVNRKPTSNINTILKRVGKIMAFTFEIIELEKQKRKIKIVNYPKGAIMFKSETGEVLIKNTENIMPENLVKIIKKIDGYVKAVPCNGKPSHKPFSEKQLSDIRKRISEMPHTNHVANFNL